MLRLVIMIAVCFAFLLYHVMAVPSNVALGKATGVSSSLIWRGDDSDVVVDGSVTAMYSFSSALDCTGCVIATNVDIQWWMVDLLESYVITGINLYTGSDDFELHKVNILTTAISTSLRTFSSLWDDVAYIESLSTVHLLVQPARIARYIAVFGKSDANIFLAEVQVYGYELADFKPTNLIFSQVQPSSVTIEWKPPDNNNTIVTEYQYNCGVDNIWVNASNNRSARQEGISDSYFESGVECQVRVGEYDVTAISQSLLCSKQQMPENLKFNTPVRKENSGRKRWKLNITWKVVGPPSMTACIDTKNAYQLTIGNNPTILYNKLSYIHYADGNERVTVSVQLRYRNGIVSEPRNASFTTSRDISPQLAPENFKLIAISPECVEMSWLPVQFPNGIGSGLEYQTNCNEAGWINSPSQSPRTSCGYEANTRVICDIRARREINSEGNQNSDMARNEIRTSCAKPSKPEFTVLQDLGDNRTINVTLVWEKSIAYCDSIDRYEMEVKETTSATSEQEYSSEVENIIIVRNWKPGTNYTISLTAVNNKDIRSVPSIQTIQTLQFECSAPPEVENAEIQAVSTEWTINTTVSYLCSDDSVMQLQCSWKNTQPEWVGEKPVCSPEKPKGKTVGIAVGVSLSVVAVVIAVILLVFFIRRRLNSNMPESARSPPHGDNLDETSQSSTNLDKACSPLYENLPKGGIRNKAFQDSPVPAPVYVNSSPNEEQCPHIYDEPDEKDYENIGNIELHPKSSELHPKSSELPAKPPEVKIKPLIPKPKQPQRSEDAPAEAESRPHVPQGLNILTLQPTSSNETAPLKPSEIRKQERMRAARES